MVDKKEEIKQHIKPDPTDLLLAEVEVRDRDPSKPHRTATFGEVAFNRGVYTGIGFGVNELSAIVIADEFQNRTGKKWFENISEWMVKNLNFKDVVKDGEVIAAKANASNMLLWGSLLISGTLLVLPMKMLEDNKGWWVKKGNHFMDWMRGNKMSGQDVAARDEEVDNALACEPKQTWPSLIVGRTIAVCTALGLGHIVGKKNSDAMSDGTEKMLLGHIQPNGAKDRWHSYAAILPLETLSCFLTSIALEISSKVFAKRGLTVRDPETCTALVHQAAPHGVNADSSSSPVDTAAKTAPAAAACETGKCDKFKKKTILPTEKHTDLAMASEAGYSMAP